MDLTAMFKIGYGLYVLTAKENGFEKAVSDIDNITKWWFPFLQLSFDFDFEKELPAWTDGILVRTVQKCGDRRYWEDWAKNIAKIAEKSELNKKQAEAAAPAAVEAPVDAESTEA